MKNLIMIGMLLILVTACKTIEQRFVKADLNTLDLYNHKGELISVDEIKKQWNERLSDQERVNARVSHLKVITLTDQSTNKKVLALLGETNRDATMTASELTPYKKGLRLSSLVATCADCHGEKLNLGLKESNWFCVNDKENKKASCTKTITMEVE